MVTKEKVLSKVAKIQKMIDPKAKKSIALLETDQYFKDIVSNIKEYIDENEEMEEDAYSAISSLISFSKEQFEENSAEVISLNNQREANICLANKISIIISVMCKKGKWRDLVTEEFKSQVSEELLENIMAYGRAKNRTIEKNVQIRTFIDTQINNFENNLHIEIDLERLSDRAGALNYISLQIEKAFAAVSPKAIEIEEEVPEVDPINEAIEEYEEETTFEIKPSFWQRIKKSVAMFFGFKEKVKALNAGESVEE